jgi:hypothetical protein
VAASPNCRICDTAVLNNEKTAKLALARELLEMIKSF